MIAVRSTRACILDGGKEQEFGQKRASVIGSGGGRSRVLLNVDEEVSRDLHA